MLSASLPRSIGDTNYQSYVAGASYFWCNIVSDARCAWIPVYCLKPGWDIVSKSSYCKTLTLSEMMQVGRLNESLPHSGAKSDEAPCGAILSSKTLQVFGTPPVFCPPSPASRHNSYYGRSAPTTTSKLQRLLTLVSRRPNLP